MSLIGRALVCAPAAAAGGVGAAACWVFVNGAAVATGALVGNSEIEDAREEGREEGREEARRERQGSGDRNAEGGSAAGVAPIPPDQSTGVIYGSDEAYLAHLKTQPSRDPLNPCHTEA